MNETLTKDKTSANTISTELLSTNLLLGINDLLGPYLITLAILPFLIAALRMIILAKVFAKAKENDLCVLHKQPKSCLRWHGWDLTRLITFSFRCYCSLIQSFHLQSSKVTNDCDITVF